MRDEPTSRRLFLATVAGLSAAGLSGCGGGGSSTTEPDGDADDAVESTVRTGSPTPLPEAAADTASPPPTGGRSTPTPTAPPTGTPDPPRTATRAPTPSAAAFADWPTYMYNDRNWGAHPDAVGPRAPVSVAWRRDLDAAQVNATPVLADGTLYVGDGRPTDDDGTLYALDPVTGETSWRLDLAGPVLGGTVVDDGLLFVAAGIDFVALRPDGTEVWRFEGNADLQFASPTVANGFVYFGSDSGRLFKIDALSSERDWTYAAAGEIPSAPVHHDGTVYLPSRDGNVYALTESGGVDWQVDLGSPVNGLSMRDERLYAAVEDGRVVQLDARGNTRWTGRVGGGAATTPAVTGDAVYVGTRDDAFVALDRGEGIEEWRFEDTDSPFTAPPVVVGGTVYVGCQDDAVYALDADSGEVEWSFATGNNIVDPAPVVAGGRVFVGSRDGSFYALGN